MSVRDLSPFHVQQWLDGMKDLTSGTKRNYCRSIKRVLRWAHQQGNIESNPIVHLEQPKAGRREQVVTADEFQELMKLIPDHSFRDLLTITWETGCRPQESLRVEARHIEAICRDRQSAGITRRADALPLARGFLAEQTFCFIKCLALLTLSRRSPMLRPARPVRRRSRQRSRSRTCLRIRQLPRG